MRPGTIDRRQTAQEQQTSEQHPGLRPVQPTEDMHLVETEDHASDEGGPNGSPVDAA